MEFFTQLLPPRAWTALLTCSVLILLVGAAPRQENLINSALHRSDRLVLSGDFDEAENVLTQAGHLKSPLIQSSLNRLARYRQLARHAVQLLTTATMRPRIRARKIADLDGDGLDDFICLLENPTGDYHRRFTDPAVVIYHSLDDFHLPVIRCFPNEGPFNDHQWIATEMNHSPGRELLLRFESEDDRDHRLAVFAMDPARGTPELQAFLETTSPPDHTAHARDLHRDGYTELIQWQAWPDRDSPCRLPAVHGWVNGRLTRMDHGYSSFFLEAMRYLRTLPADSLDRLQGEALLLEQADRRDQADRCYRKILALIPPDALHGPLISSIRAAAARNRQRMHSEQLVRNSAPLFAEPEQRGSL